MKNVSHKVKVTLLAIITILVIAKIFHYVINYRFGDANINILQAIGLSTFVTSPFWLIVPVFNRLDKSAERYEKKQRKSKKRKTES